MEAIEYTITDPFAGRSVCRGSIADLMLDTFLIPPCGLIPPFEVAASVLMEGGMDGGMSPGCIWNPFKLEEADYWEAVSKLESMTSEDLAARHRDPQIAGEMQADYSAPKTDNHMVWLESLKRRGLLPYNSAKS